MYPDKCIYRLQFDNDSIYKISFAYTHRAVKVVSNLSTAGAKGVFEQTLCM